MLVGRLCVVVCAVLALVLGGLAADWGQRSGVRGEEEERPAPPRGAGANQQRGRRRMAG